MGNTGNPSYQVRRNWIKKIIRINDLWPTTEEYKEKYPLTKKSSMYRDYESVRKDLNDPIRDETLKAQVYGRMQKRVPELDDSNLVRLFIGMRPKAIDVKQTTEHKGEIVIKAWKLGDADKPRDNSEVPT